MTQIPHEDALSDSVSLAPFSAALIEPSFLDALQLIEADAELTRSVKTHWGCSLRRIAHWLDRPLQLVPARLTAVRIQMGQLHAAQLGVASKSLANHRSNVGAALRWMRAGERSPARGAALSPDWASLRQQLTDLPSRARLSGFLRYCSAQGRAPDAVTQAIFDAYIAYRAATTSLPVDASARRLIARAWNAHAGATPGWPTVRLLEPAIASTTSGPAWEEFPKGLRDDVDAYLVGLTRLRRMPSGRRIRPCKPSTIRVCRAKLVAAARTAVRVGVAPEALQSLADLLRPGVGDKVLDAYWQADGDEPFTYTIELARLFHAIARETGCLGPE